MYEQFLQDIGLNPKEAAVYIALLKVDASSVLELSGKTKIKRPTLYLILKALSEKGLVSETTVGKKTRFQAESPERLESYIERQKVVLDEQARRVKDIIPQMKSVMRETGEKPIVKLYEGRQGIIAMNDELYESDDEGGTAYLLYSNDLLNEVFSQEERQKYKKVRLQKQVKTKVIYNKKDGHIDSDNTGERVRVDEVRYPISCDISIYKDRVRVGILGKKLSGIFIRSKDFSDTLRSLFNIAFENTKEQGASK